MDAMISSNSSSVSNSSGSGGVVNAGEDGRSANGSGPATGPVVPAAAPLAPAVAPLAPAVAVAPFASATPLVVPAAAAGPAAAPAPSLASLCRITFVGVDPSEPPKVEVRAWLERLGALTAPMIAGHVVIDATGDPRKPRLFQVRMELTMPDGLVVVGTEHPSNKAHEDLYCAIRNAFRAARRQLEQQVLAREAGSRQPGTS